MGVREDAQRDVFAMRDDGWMITSECEMRDVRFILSVCLYESRVYLLFYLSQGFFVQMLLLFLFYI